MQDNRYHSSIPTPQKSKKPNRIYLYIFIFFAAAIFITIIVSTLSKPSDKPEETSAETLISAPDLESSGKNALSDLKVLSDRYEYIDFDISKIYEGSLILVNSENEYKFQNEKIKNVYDEKTSSYKVKDRSVYLDETALSAFNDMMDAFNAASGKNDVMVVSGYRTYEFQEEILNERIEEQGEKTALMYVALPGHSEHHTGLAMDLNVLTSSGLTKTLKDDEVYEWIFENCYKYGFILRYAQDKVTITGISNEPWHFRYVGIPHAYYMYTNNLCLEEYNELLKNYSYGETKLDITLPLENQDGSSSEKKYEVYYVEADNAVESCSVPVPRDTKYTVSGNNRDGFIVTSEKS